MVVINSISLSSVVSLIKSDITLISSVMDFHLLSQYSRRILVRVSPKSICACSHFSCRYELTTGTCGVRVTQRFRDGPVLFTFLQVGYVMVGSSELNVQFL